MGNICGNSQPQTVICMKWGDRYGPEYVNRLWSMIGRNTQRDTRLICFTDDAAGIDPAVVTEPLPEINIPDRVSRTPWRKLSVWRSDLAASNLLLSDDILFIDLDMVIVGSLDEFFDFSPGEFCVIKNWTQKRKNVGNTSLFRFPAQRFSHIFEYFDQDPEKVLGEYRIEQQYISAEIRNRVFWPEAWCLSYKHSIIPRWPLNFFKPPELPANARVIAFTGKPDIDEAAQGEWPVTRWYKRLYKFVRPAPWLLDHWR